MLYEWESRETDDRIINELVEKIKVSRICATLLMQRGCISSEDTVRFLNPQLIHLHSPFLLDDMVAGVERIRRACEQKEVCAIFADSDLDGLTSMSIMYQLFMKLGCKPLVRYLKGQERYGLTESIVQELIDQHVTFLVTVDSGIRDIDAINFAKQNNIDVIVCDHHEPGDVLPEAICINPKMADSEYPTRHLAGVGVAFKLSCAVVWSFTANYNKSVIILLQDEDHFETLILKNGVVLKKISLESLSDIQCNTELIDVKRIYHFNLSDESTTLISSMADRYELIFNLNDYLLKKYNNQKNYILRFCKDYSLQSDVSKLDLAKYIFNDAELTFLPKYANHLRSILDLVALGTISDIMPLTGENRTLVVHGLKQLANSTTAGLNLLQNKLSCKDINADYIGWQVAPLLNTPGRYGMTSLTAEYLIENDNNRLEDLYNEIQHLNAERKNSIMVLQQQLLLDLKEDSKDSQILFVVRDDVPDGLVGLLAGRLTDDLNKPVILISTAEITSDNIVKGSGRCNTGINFFSYIEPLEEHFENIGGHAQAFGFTIHLDKIDFIKNHLETTITGEIQKPVKNYDLEIGLTDITWELFNELQRIEPFGHANEAPIFLSRNVCLKSCKILGKSNDHLKFMFTENQGVEGLAWNWAKYKDEITGNNNLSIYYKIEKNDFNGNSTLRLNLIDWE